MADWRKEQRLILRKIREIESQLDVLRRRVMRYSGIPGGLSTDDREEIYSTLGQNSQYLQWLLEKVV